jgi:hypothetical protein
MLHIFFLLIALWIPAKASDYSTSAYFQNTAPCIIGNYSHELRRLSYNGGSHPVRIPYSHWTSARVSAEIAYILLTEVMNYSTELLDTQTVFSAQAVSYVSGCFDPDDSNCTHRRTDDPQAHFTVEVWRDGIVRAAQLPVEVQPVLTSVLEFTVSDQADLRPSPGKAEQTRMVGGVRGIKRAQFANRAEE